MSARIPTARLTALLNRVIPRTALELTRGLALPAAVLTLSLTFFPSLAQADSCSVSFPAQPARSALSAGLPDCRAYEQVTPVFKGGGDASAFALTDDGNTVMYEDTAAFSGPSGGNLSSLFKASRSTSGWHSASAMPPASQYEDHLQIFDISPDLTTYLGALVRDPFGGSVPGNTDIGTYVVNNDGSIVDATPLGDTSIGFFAPADFAVSYAGGSYDSGSGGFSHVVVAGTNGFAAALDELTQGFPVGRAGTVEEIASAVTFLASPQASYVQGATLDVDGGIVAV